VVAAAPILAVAMTSSFARRARDSAASRWRIVRPILTWTVPTLPAPSR